MPEVHPTAIIDDRAELADDVVVGPQCVIEGRVRLGPGCRLLHRVSLRGPMEIGETNVFYPNACIGFPPQDLKFDPQIEGPGVKIGNANVFREGATIHRATGDRPTTLGSHNYFMANSHAGHDTVVGDHVMLANGVLLAGHVEVADGAILGGNCAIHQFSRIGRLAMISGLVAIVLDVPPFCTAYNMRSVESLNMVGLRRAGYRRHIPNLKRAFDLLFREERTRPTAVAKIEAELSDDPLCREFVEFVKTTRRGITAYPKASVGKAVEQTT